MCTVQVRSAGLGSGTRLSLQLNKAKKSVSGDDFYIKRANCVGAVGYAVVLPDRRVPDNDFFRTDIRFRVRLRYVISAAWEFSQDLGNLGINLGFGEFSKHSWEFWYVQEIS